MNPELPRQKTVPWPSGYKQAQADRVNNFTCDNISSSVQKGALESWSGDVTEKQET